MKRIGAVVALLPLMIASAAAQTLADSFPPCAQATEKLKPADIHLVEYGQSPPETPLTLQLLLSSDGIDVYRVGDTAGAVFVYQNEKVRRQKIDAFGNSGLVGWIPGFVNDRQIWQPDWAMIVDLKYAYYQFRWAKERPEASLVETELFAPPECYAAKKTAGNLASNELGVAASGAGYLAHDSFEYRVAMAMRDASEERAAAHEDFATSFPVYFKEITNRVSAAWNRQEISPHTPYGTQVCVTFTVTRNGSIRDVHLSQPSPSPTLNSSAEHALRRVGAFDPLPENYPGADVTVAYTFTYTGSTAAEQASTH
jgi:TonB family protein